MLLGPYETCRSLAVKVDAGVRTKKFSSDIITQFSQRVSNNLFVLQVPATHFNRISEALQKKDAPCTAYIVLRPPFI